MSPDESLRGPVPELIYGQELELEICVRCSGLLGSPVAIDVGAERGSFTRALRAGGYERVVAVEPHPENVRALREEFGGDAGVTVIEAAASDVPGSAPLRLAQHGDAVASEYHTLEGLADAADVQWVGSIDVPLITIGDLVADGSVPERVGLLKADTEGHDLAVLRGLGALRCDLVVVEHWLDLPRSVGRSPSSLDDFRYLLEPRGFADYACVVHSPVGSSVQWNTVEMQQGDWGNLVFVHSDVRDRVAPVIMGAMTAAQGSLHEHLRAAEGAAAQRLAALEEATAESESQRAAAEERLVAMEQMARELERLRGEGTA